MQLKRLPMYREGEGLCHPTSNQSTDLAISFILPDHVRNHALSRLTIFHFDII